MKWFEYDPDLPHPELLIKTPPIVFAPDDSDEAEQTTEDSETE